LTNDANERFARDAGSKDQKVVQLRQRLAAATPQGRKPESEKWKWPQLEKRSLIAAVLVVIFLLSMLQGLPW